MSKDVLTKKVRDLNFLLIDARLSFTNLVHKAVLSSLGSNKNETYYKPVTSTT